MSEKITDNNLTSILKKHKKRNTIFNAVAARGAYHENDIFTVFLGKLYKKSTNNYSSSDSENVILSDLSLFVEKNHTMRAIYFLKVLADWKLRALKYGPFFNFILPNKEDTLFGSEKWPPNKNNRDITVYNFAINNSQNTNLNSMTINTKKDKILNIVKIDIEYTNYGESGCLLLQINKNDLLSEPGHTSLPITPLTILNGSSVTCEIYPAGGALRAHPTT